MAQILYFDNVILHTLFYIVFKMGMKKNKMG